MKSQIRKLYYQWWQRFSHHLWTWGFCIQGKWMNVVQKFAGSQFEITLHSFLTDSLYSFALTNGRDDSCNKHQASQQAPEWKLKKVLLTIWVI